MDIHNNNLGIEIGNRLRQDPDSSWEDVVNESRKLFYINNSDGSTARWLDESHLFNAVNGVKEVVFAFPPSIATDTMILYVEDKLKDCDLIFTKIAQGGAYRSRAGKYRSIIALSRFTIKGQGLICKSLVI